jgi:hypothetical protein
VLVIDTSRLTRAKVIIDTNLDVSICILFCYKLLFFIFYDQYYWLQNPKAT